MWYFFIPGTEYLFALISLGLIAWLIGSGLMSGAKKVFESPREPPSEDEIKKMMEELGPMSRKERIVGGLVLFLIIGLFVAFIVWLAKL